jgi:hypothetical protein
MSSYEIVRKYEQETYYKQKIADIYKEYLDTHEKYSYTTEDCLIDLWVKLQELKVEAQLSYHFYGVHEIQTEIDTIDKLIADADL